MKLHCCEPSSARSRFHPPACFYHTNLKKSTVSRKIKKEPYLNLWFSERHRRLCAATRTVALITRSNTEVNSSLQQEILTDYNPHTHTKKKPRTSLNLLNEESLFWSTQSPYTNSPSRSDWNDHRRRNIFNKPHLGLPGCDFAGIQERAFPPSFSRLLRRVHSRLGKASGGGCFRPEGVRSRQREGGKQSEGGDGEGWSRKIKVIRSREPPVASALRFWSVTSDLFAGAPSLPNLHVIGWEEAVRAPAHASPPPLVDHLDVGDDVIGVEGDLVVAGWNRRSIVQVKGHKEIST